MASIRSYKAYERFYAKFANTNAMKTPMMTKEKFDFSFEEVTAAGISNPARFIARGQRLTSKAQLGVYMDAAKAAWKEASAAGILDLFKDELGINNKKQFNKKFIQTHSEEIFDFLRNQLGLDESDISNYLSPKETGPDGGTVAAGEAAA